MSLFNRMSLDQAFELLLNRKIIAREFKQANRKINKLKNNDWRLWFGRFLLCIRSDAENYRFTEAYICLAEAEALLKEANNPNENEKFYSLINNESLFLVFKFYYETAGLTSLALYLARAYQNGWGVKRDLEKAHKFAQKAVTMNEYEPIYENSVEVLNSILSEISFLKEENLS
ncbi:MAG: SEL1-like repeat protein [Ruminococcaceae bacterium]|nr:SEL1-like repeat protein [Oscillospiraceae bacterium]